MPRITTGTPAARSRSGKSPSSGHMTIGRYREGSRLITTSINDVALPPWAVLHEFTRSTVRGLLLVTRWPLSCADGLPIRCGGMHYVGIEGVVVRNHPLE